MRRQTVAYPSMTHLRNKKGHTMYQQNALATIDTEPTTQSFAAVALTVSALKTEHTAEALQFLAARPIHTVAMVGFINDNGINSPLNRGTFYGCRNQSGELEGVALIGHAVLMETRTTRAVQAFANIAQSISGCHMIMGEQQQVGVAWARRSAGRNARSAPRNFGRPQPGNAGASRIGYAGKRRQPDGKRSEGL